MTFRGNRLSELALRPASVWILTDIAESKGRQDLFTRQSPQLLEAMRRQAIVQSVESSNRIEGVTVAPRRLQPLLFDDAKAETRSEEEVQNYRRALDLIHRSAGDLPITPALVRRTHRIVTEGSGDAGQWKKVANEIVDLRPGAAPVVRFRPVAPSVTPAAVEEVCLAYRHVLGQKEVPSLVAVGSLVLDFLCIHPFRDGNGRVSRLLTLLALYQHGYEVGRYVSLERLVEDSKEDYYESLRRSSEGWHEGKHDLVPWLNFFLGILRRAYRVFEERAGAVKSPRGAKTALVETAIDGFFLDFTLGDLERACPGVSRDMVRRVLRNLRRAGRVECLGRGPGARWRKKG